MKKKLAAVLAACAALVLAAGCSTKTYEIYTNIPADGYKITSRGFKLSQYIGGAPERTSADGVDKSHFTTRRSVYYNIMNSDAALYVSADFTEETIQKLSNLSSSVNTALTAINNSLSVTVESSCISNFNNAEAGTEVELDETAYTVLSLAKEMYKLTDGYYNPAVYYSVQAYGFDGSYNYPKTAAQLPKAEEIENYKTLSQSFGDIALRQDGESYYATKPVDLKIDLGGIGKGYAVDVVNGLIKDSGFEYGYFSFADSSIAFGKYIKGNNNYTLQPTNPRNRIYTYADIPIQGECVSTSGDYFQYYEIGGVRYCHIINPATGKPVHTGIISATVIGESAAKADALSTAVMAMGKDKAVEFIANKLQNYRVVFVYDKAAETDDVA